MKCFATFDNEGNRTATYVEGIHADIPADAIEISEEDQNLYVTGDYIRGSDGKPARKPAHVPTTEELLASIRTKRDTLLNQTMWIFQRQQTGSAEQKLSDEQYQKWLDYWAALRDFPDTCDPKHPAWPVQPM